MQNLVKKSSPLRTTLLTRPKLDVQILEGNDKLTRFYTGMPTYDSITALVDYLAPKVKDMKPWNGNKSEQW